MAETESVDEFSKHEVLHTVAIFRGMFEEHVIDASYTQQESEVLKLSEEIGDKLDELYQLLGNKTLS